MDFTSVIDAYFRDNPYYLTQHHLDSYNMFIKDILPDLVKTLNPFVMIKSNPDNPAEVIHKVSVYIGGLNGDKLYFSRPTLKNEQVPLFPNEARLRNATYGMDLHADIIVKYWQKEKQETEDQFKSVRIGSIPIMLHSDACMLRNKSKPILRELGECPYDYGGYFIVDGKEKVIIAQERIATNRFFISQPTSDKIMYKGLIRCTAESGESRLYPKTVFFKLMYPKMKLAKNEKGNGKEKDKETIEGGEEDNGREPKSGLYGSIQILLPKIFTDIPLWVLFRALGVESDQDILNCITEDLSAPFQNILRPSILNASDLEIYDQESAVNYLAAFTKFKTVTEVRMILLNELFPNISSSSDALRKKALYLGYLCRQLILVPLGIKPATDRDSFVFKRVDLSGFLLANQFRNAYNAFRNNVRNQLDQIYLYGTTRTTGILTGLIKKDNLTRIFSPSIIDESMVRFLKGTVKEGIVQDLARLSYQGFISHLRRVDNPMDRSIKLAAPHRLHSQQYGIMCPFESPDGKSVGFLKNLAMTARVTFGTSVEPIRETLTSLSDSFEIHQITGIEHPHTLINSCTIFVNGDWYGYISELRAHELVTKLRSLRNGILDPLTSIAWDIINREIRIQVEAGRCCRPVLATPIKSTDRPLKWDELIRTGEINYLDIEEADGSLIAMWPSDLTSKHTHCEIHPSLAFSVVTNNTPFLNHNQAPRNIFAGSQGKQAIGMYATNFCNRIDTMAYTLSYPQKPLILTRYAPFIHSDAMPTGENLIVAIMTYTGYNQEDSVILNRRSLQRGQFRTNIYKSVVDKEEIHGGNMFMFKASGAEELDRSLFINPVTLLESGKLEHLNRDGDYSALDENGVVKLGTVIDSRLKVALVGKCRVQSTVQNLNETGNGFDSIFDKRVKTDLYSEQTVFSDKSHYGVVDKIYVNESGNGRSNSSTRVCKIRLRQTRSPELGDKMCSKHGQKGTVGTILAQEDMPFSKEGLVPDIIVNPHAFPSRMTIGHIIECVVAKVCSLEGQIADGTAFINLDVDAIANRLTAHKYERDGNEILYNGKTGEQMPCDIYFGPTYYQRLKHMVEDKSQSRSTGPKVTKTHQPTPGRGHGGGLRIGEMERDAMISHGAAQFLKESMMERSDKFTMHLCEQCGEIPVLNIKKTNALAYCPNCKNETHFAKVEVPYAFKLLMQEMEAMNIVPRLTTSLNP